MTETPSGEREKRRFQRIPFEALVTLTCPTGQWESYLLDVSLKGALVERPESWQGTVDTPCTLVIRLGDEAASIDMEGVLAHADEHRLGIKWDHIDVESLSHLRRLLELNIGDAQALERELGKLVEV